MHGDAVGDANADGADLVVPVRAVDPHAANGRRRVHRARRRRGDVDHQLLEPAHVLDHVDRLGQTHDRVAGELPGAVPGDLAAAVDVDDRCAVGGPFRRRRAFAGGEDARVLAEDERVRGGAVDDVPVDATLEFPAVEVGQVRGRHSGNEDVGHGGQPSIKCTQSNNSGSSCLARSARQRRSPR